MNEVMTQGNNALKVEDNITELYQRFINYIDASEKTVETYRKAIKQFIDYLAVNNIKEPTRENVISFREELKENHKPTTVQNYITAVRLFFNWTEAEGLYPNIANHIKGAKLNKEHKKDYLTPNQIKDILGRIDRETPQGKRDYALLTLLVTCGLRTIEINRALVEDIRTSGGQTVIYLQGKGREEKAESVILPPATEKAIREYLKVRGSAEPKEPLFMSTSNNSKGEPLSTRTIRGIVKERFEEAGFNSDRLTAHSLRHTAVTLALLSGQDIQSTQQFARHKNIETTLIYAHNLESANNKCSNAIADILF